MVPCSKADANWFDAQGNPFRIVMSSEFDYTNREIISGEQGVIRSDTNEHIATHSSSIAFTITKAGFAATV